MSSNSGIIDRSFLRPQSGQAHSAIVRMTLLVDGLNLPVAQCSDVSLILASSDHRLTLPCRGIFSLSIDGALQTCRVTLDRPGAAEGEYLFSAATAV